jgi:hypothetical protein
MTAETEMFIEQKEAELLSLQSRMETIKKEFIMYMVNFACEWFKKTAKEYITKYPEIILEMSEEKIASMKAKISELLKESKKIVELELDNPALWWHQKSRKTESLYLYTQVADKYPEIIDQAVRRVLGRLGKVLEESGFNVITRNDLGEYKEFWFEQVELETGIKKTVLYYPHLLAWTEEMQDTIEEYNIQYTKALNLYNEIIELKEEKKRKEALTRWNLI